MFEVIAYIAILVGLAAGFLWGIERIAKRIGGRNTWLLFLVGLPLVAGVMVAWLNRTELAWWQLVLYPLVAPFVASAVLLLAYAAVNPYALIALVGALCRRARERIFHAGKR
ncbi:MULTISPECIES: hypothetical protein [unclassified Polaromonas]|uniref:hypothetical protein n=1 Tax=unclassified Polaromonas TaxID=2638319 RepID=UPI000F0962AB|nr:MULTISPECIES: hypothetical protein [unclassified Polaromonas]AYQ28777.1 hypothetical protein DT070_12510 [Polaromonas sp. SP1]QGJ20108.1 hypothetical protein F7R28_18090 [Polaromonas sp. Pch-P]